MTKQKLKEMLDERIGQKDAHKLEEYEWIVGLMEMVAYEVECDLGAKNMLLETELNQLKEENIKLLKKLEYVYNKAYIIYHSANAEKCNTDIIKLWDAVEEFKPIKGANKYGKQL